MFDIILLSLTDPGLSRQHTRDERGQRVEIGHTYLNREIRRASDPGWRAYLKEARHDVRCIGRRFRALVAFFFVLLGLATAPLFWLLVHGGVANGMSVVSGMTPPVFMVLLGAAVWHGNFGLRGRKVRDVLLSRGLCASCLCVLPPDAEEDDCTVCPECGAAWRLNEQPASQSPARDPDHNDSGAPS